MRDLLQNLRTPMLYAALISIGVNMLMLVSPIFMMQVFDRVLMSGHLDTLYGLSILAIAALLVLGLLETFRQQVLVRAGDWLDRAAGAALIQAVLGRGIPLTQAFGHVASIKRFFCTQSVFALLDAPWMFVFAALLWWMHPWLGIVAVSGACILMAIALLTEAVSRKPLNRANEQQIRTQGILSSALRNADAVRSMGMGDRLSHLWENASATAHDEQFKAGDRGALTSGAAKAVRLIIQTITLGVGALLVLEGSLSAGGMIAASILLGRCLAPVEQAIGAWKGFVQARSGWSELKKIEGCSGAAIEAIELPAPTGRVEIDALSYAPDTSRPPILSDITMAIEPGSVTCLVGPSGSGKTTLSRLVVGAIAPTGGEVRLDGRSVTGWNNAQLGDFVGYLPQRVELLPGSIKDNIARFKDCASEDVIEAARAAGVDEMIRGLPDGYETEIQAESHPFLSAGQLQRVGLARALFGKPCLLVLDEPNANLDVEGERSLSKSVQEVARMDVSVLVISHRPSLIEIADRIAVLRDGKLVREGPREKVLKPAEAIRKLDLTAEQKRRWRHQMTPGSAPSGQAASTSP